MTETTKKALMSIRLQLDLPANLRGKAIELSKRFDAAEMDQLQRVIRYFRKAG